MEGLEEWIKILLSMPCGNGANAPSFDMMENGEEKGPKIHLGVFDFSDMVKCSVF